MIRLLEMFPALRGKNPFTQETAREEVDEMIANVRRNSNTDSEEMIAAIEEAWEAR